MRARVLVLASLFVIGCAHARLPAGAGAEWDLRYGFELFRDPLTAVKVTLAARGGPDGATTFAVERGFEDEIRELSARGEDGRPLELERLAANRWRVRHREGEWLDLSYALAPTEPRAARSRTVAGTVAGADAEADDGGAFRPLVTRSLFQLIGETALVYPERAAGGAADAPLRIEVAWRGFREAGWVIRSSLGDGERVRVVRRLEAFRRSLFLAGELRAHEDASAALRVAVSGARWGFDAEALAHAVAPLFAAQRASFGGGDASPELVTLVEAESPSARRQLLGDARLDGAIALYASPDPRNPERTLDRIRERVANALAEDVFRARLPAASPEARLAWFSEGFAQFYGRRLLRRAGRASLAEEIAALNRAFTRYLLNDARDAGNDWLEAADGKVAELNALARDRGEMLAWIVDADVRRVSGGARTLDDLVRELLRRAEGGGQTAPLDTPRVLEAIQQFGSAETAELVWGVVEHGAVPQIDPRLFAPCLRASVEPRGPYELGFDFEASRKGRVVKGVRFGSRAYQSGLRNGQRLLDWTIPTENPDEVVELKVSDNGVPLRLTYTPQGRSVMVPVFALDREAACTGL